MPLLAKVLTALISSLIARLLMGAGLSILTYKWVEELLDELIRKAQNSLNSIPEFTLALVKLTELDLCISMLIGTVKLLIMIKVARLSIGKA